MKPSSSGSSSVEEKQDSGGFWKVVWGVSAIAFLRILGMFFVLAVFSRGAELYEGATPARVGLAMSLYAYMQALFQIPFGWLGDRWGVRKALVSALLLFLVGSLVCTFATTIEGLMIGRALQGMGAVAGLLQGVIVRAVPRERHARAFMIFGISIGSAVILGIIAGAILESLVGFRGLFGILTILSAIALLVVLGIPLPESPQIPFRQGFLKTSRFIFRRIGRVMIVDFFLAWMFQLMFYFVPRLVRLQEHIRESQIYLPGVLLSVLMYPLVSYGERRGTLIPLFWIFWLIYTGVLAGSFLGWSNWADHLMQGIHLENSSGSGFIYIAWIGGVTLALGTYSFLNPVVSAMASWRLTPDVAMTGMAWMMIASFLGSGMGAFWGGWMEEQWGLVQALLFSSFLVLGLGLLGAGLLKTGKSGIRSG